MDPDPAKTSPVVLAYEVALCVNPRSDTVGVVADVFIEVAAPTSQLFFDAIDLAVERITANGPSRSQLSQVTTNGSQLIASFAEPLIPGVYRILVELSAPLRSDGRGLHHNTATDITLSSPHYLWPLLRATGLPTVQLRTITPNLFEVTCPALPISDSAGRTHRTITFAPTPPMDPADFTLTIATPVFAPAN